MPWWSITKSVLATAVLKLIDLGAMRLDAFFEDWPFTIRQLLQHTSGLTNYGGPAYQRAVASGDAVWLRWPRLFGQSFRFDEWSLCRG